MAEGYYDVVISTGICLGHVTVVINLMFFFRLPKWMCSIVIQVNRPPTAHGTIEME